MSAPLPIIILLLLNKDCVVISILLRCTIITLTSILLPARCLSHSIAQGPRRHSVYLWVFGEKGVQIFTPDNVTILKSLLLEKVCKETKQPNSLTCIHYNFYDVVSNGKKVRPATLVPLCSTFSAASPFSHPCNKSLLTHPSVRLVDHGPRRPHGGCVPCPRGELCHLWLPKPPRLPPPPRDWRLRV